MAKNESPESVVLPEAGAIPEVLPLFISKELVIYPGLIVPMQVVDEKIVEMVDDVVKSGVRTVGFFLQKPDAETEDIKDVHAIGSAVTIHRMLRMADGSLRLIVQGLERVELEDFVREEPYPMARVKVIPDKTRKTLQLDALVHALREDFTKMADISPNFPEEFSLAVHNLDDPGGLADLIASNLNLEAQVRQQILATIRVPERLRMIRRLVDREIKVITLGNEIQDQTRQEIEKGQREYYLRQQLSQIRKELGEDDEGSSEAKEWRRKVSEADLPERVLEVANKEIERLERMNPASAEYSVVLTYLDWLVTLPWNEMSEDHLDINHARDILNEDHYGLEDVKERILEVLAVRKLKPDAQGPILCLVGPPGVGKTSLGKSIARAMGREFVRISLGGIRDEAEIRGHRRTYVGALPGKILQQMKKAGTRNPVFMLDEIDKLVSDFRGDPSSALLEVLDPAQNDTFNDHYVDIDFDLSATFFIATANYIDNIPAPLRDRMEVIRLSGYIAEEKYHIADRYLVPRQIEANGLRKKDIRFHKGAIEDVITYYTREAGVRNLERTIGSVCRKVAMDIATESSDGKTSVVSKKNLPDYLGPRKVSPAWTSRKNRVGVTTGLAYTAVGGTVLEIETMLMPGKGALRITGRLGDVMKESAQIAVSWIRAHSRKFGIKKEKFDHYDLHIHVPEGATPKDGPSAGVTMTTSLASRYSGCKVRGDVAMTGEITLGGSVLPIGGLKEKTVAAYRSRIKHVIIPWENQKDLEKIPEEIKEKIEFHPVKTIDEVLDFALMGKSGKNN